jgi:hypothetical protein
MSTQFVALADTGEEVAATEAHDRAGETDALLVLAARALSEARQVGTPLRLVAVWPDTSVVVGYVESGRLVWELGENEDAPQAECPHVHVHEVARGPAAAFLCTDCGRLWT